MYVVGCGDGVVYFVGEDGFVHDAYVFPDRIRVVRIDDDGQLLVASEDRYLYRATTWRRLLMDHYADAGVDAIYEHIRDVERQFNTTGPLAIAQLTVDEKLLLLRYSDLWLGRANAALAVHIIDSIKGSIIDSNGVKLHYWYASGLVALATRGDFAVGKARIQDYLTGNVNNIYALHSLLSVISHHRLRFLPTIGREPAPTVLIDTIVSMVPFDDDWILEECCRHLLGAEFFSLTSRGFVSYFTSVNVPFNKLKLLMEFASKCEITALKESPAVRLMQLLQLAPLERREYDQALSTCMLDERGDQDVKRAVEDLYAIASTGATHSELVKDIKARFLDGVSNRNLKGVISDVLERSSSGETRELILIQDLLQERLHRCNCSVSARDYLEAVFCLGALAVLAKRQP